MPSQAGRGLSHSRLSRRVPSLLSCRALLLTVPHGAARPGGTRLELVVCLPLTYSPQKSLVARPCGAVRCLDLVRVPTKLNLTDFRRFSLVNLQLLLALC